MINNIYTSKVTVNDRMRKAVEEVFDSGIFVMGPKIKEFENKFAKFIGTNYAIGISNGTTAIELVLQSLGINESDEIIVPSHTAFPTIEPIIQLKARPVFADIDEKTYTIDPNKIEQLITKKTKAIIVVHLYGLSADLDPILAICKKHNIFLVEDCCQAHNAEYKGKKVGTFGVAGCFSFYPSKNLTVCGDGGMIVTNNKDMDRTIRILLNHGQDGTYNHVMLGHNYRLSEIPCAIGIEQLAMVEDFTKRRREIATLYTKNLSVKGIITPYEPSYSKGVYHLYVIRVDSKIRDKVIESLKNEGIHCGVHYPLGCHQQKAITWKTSLPVTEKIVKEIITLPIYPLLKDDEVLMITHKIKEIVAKN